MAGGVALEGADGVSGAFSFAGSACDVVLGCGVVSLAVEDDGVGGAVELAVAAPAGPCRVVRPLEAGKGATPTSRAKAASELTRLWCDQVTISCAGDYRADAGLVEKLRDGCANVAEDLTFECVGGRALSRLRGVLTAP